MCRASSLEKQETRTDKAGKTHVVRTRINDIPHIDIGVERSISRTELMPAEGMVGLKPLGKVDELKTQHQSHKKNWIAI